MIIENKVKTVQNKITEYSRVIRTKQTIFHKWEVNSG